MTATGVLTGAGGGGFGDVEHALSTIRSNAEDAVGGSTFAVAQLDGRCRSDLRRCEALIINPIE
jgi:hypothetical protein